MATDDEIELTRRYCKKLESHLLEAVDKFDFDEEIPSDLATIGTQMALLLTALWHRCISDMIVEDDDGHRRVAELDELPDPRVDRKNWMALASDLYRDFYD